MIPGRDPNGGAATAEVDLLPWKDVTLDWDPCLTECEPVWGHGFVGCTPLVATTTAQHPRYLKASSCPSAPMARPVIS